MERENIKEIVGRCIFVALGSFNPAILHPEWLSRHKILPEEEIVGLFAEPLRKEIPELGAIIEFGQNFVVSPTQTSLHLKSFILNVTREKFEICCEKREKFPLMIDSVKKIFLLLSETPIKAYGLNFDEHMKFDKTLSEIAVIFFTETDNVRQVFGHDCLVGHKIITKVGDATLTFNFEPSRLIDDGVFFKINFHFENDAPDTKFIVEKIGKNFEGAITFIERFFSSYCGNLIERKEIKWIKVMQSNTLAKEIIYHQESLPNNGDRVISSPLDATDSMALPNTSPIKDKVIHFKNIDREPRIQEREVGWWIGKVTAIREETFDAVMEDLSGNVNVVELEKELIDPHEQDLLFINSKFTYAISRIDKPDGREYKTKFSFSSRRKWLKEYEIEAKRLADEFFPDSLLSL